MTIVGARLILFSTSASTTRRRKERRVASRRRRVPNRMPVRLSGLWKAGVAMQAIARSARSEVTEHSRPDQATSAAAAAITATTLDREGCAVDRCLSSMSVSAAVAVTDAEPEVDYFKRSAVAAAEGDGYDGSSEVRAPSSPATSTLTLVSAAGESVLCSSSGGSEASPKTSKAEAEAEGEAAAEEVASPTVKIVDGVDGHPNQACRDADTAISEGAVDANAATAAEDGAASDLIATTTAARTTDANAISSYDVISSSDDVTSAAAGDARSSRVDEENGVSIGLERRVPEGEGGGEERCEDRPGRSLSNSYDFGRSTEESYRVEHRQFSDRFREARSLLDYSYHDNYSLERQKVQDKIIVEALGSNTPGFLERPWIVFTAGAMGAGKSHVMELLGEFGIFPLDSFVRVDPDRLRRELPEMQGYVEKDPATAGLLTHKEAGLMAEILEETALLEGRNILVDGSMRDGEWYALHVAGLRQRFPRLRVAIIHVWAPREQVLARAARRATQTGRVIPPDVLEETLEAVPQSVDKLAPLADYCVRIDNIGNTASQRSSVSPSFRLYPDGDIGSTCGGLCAGSGEPVCNGSGESECNGDGEAVCNGSGGFTAELPVLATPGETWETFRRTFCQGPWVGMVPEDKSSKQPEELTILPVEVEELVA